VRSLLGVVNVMGSLLAMFALYFALPAVTALIYGESALWNFLIAGAITGGAGLLLRFATQRFKSELKPRDGYLLVTLSWLVVAGAATLPLMLEMRTLSITDAYFETMSALSTTGSTVLNGLEDLPHSINMWRHALAWLGGMGIIVLAVAILPLLGVGGMQMYRAEAPGPVKDTRLTPRITETARLLWLVYAGFTAACAASLWAAGMSLFDAICHAFDTLSLTGFSNYDANVGHFDSPLIECVLIVFMLVAAINFATHFVVLRRRDTQLYARDPEAKWMLTWIIVSCAMCRSTSCPWPRMPVSSAPTTAIGRFSRRCGCCSCPVCARAPARPAAASRCSARWC
jgi:trk system potassium uptake protein TrkH